MSKRNGLHSKEENMHLLGELWRMLKMAISIYVMFDDFNLLMACPFTVVQNLNPNLSKTLCPPPPKKKSVLIFRFHLSSWNIASSLKSRTTQRKKLRSMEERKTLIVGVVCIHLIGLIFQSVCFNSADELALSPSIVQGFVILFSSN